MSSYDTQQLIKDPATWLARQTEILAAGNARVNKRERENTQAQLVLLRMLGDQIKLNMQLLALIEALRDNQNASTAWTHDEQRDAVSRHEGQQSESVRREWAADSDRA